MLLVTARAWYASYHQVHLNHATAHLESLLAQSVWWGVQSGMEMFKLPDKGQALTPNLVYATRLGLKCRQCDKDPLHAMYTANVQ